ATAIHYTTDAERDLAAPLGLLAPTIVEPNGIDSAEYDNLPPRGQFRARHHIPPDRKVILFLGRLHHKKGFDILLPAFALLKDDPSLVIAGPGEDDYIQYLRAQIGRLGLTERVVFAGMLGGGEKRGAFVDADIFVLPSYQENFGIAVIEALAAGTPVIVSDQVNIHADIFAAGAGGVVPLNSEVLALEMKRWLADGALRKAAGEKAREFARNKYDWKSIAQRWTRHYERLVAET
ncbi:MAG: glycosyltransferase, partial [Candidatus Acidiferrum sp.]